MRIVYVAGARPNFVKMAPLIAALRKLLPDGRHVLVHTGQHYDPLLSQIFLEELGLPAPDYELGMGSASHAVQTARAMERLEPVLERERPDLVIVPGDVNSTLAAALVAAKCRIPLAHVEAGLRSFDRTMPEEINRIVADEFAQFLLVHCDEAIANLRAEGIEDSRIHLVGNTMIDTLIALEGAFRTREVARSLSLRPGEYLLVTLHRPALVDGPLLADALLALERVAREVPVVFPAHPRTRRAMEGLPVSRNINVIEPLGYLDFLSLESDAAGVLTDSGGIQEETTYLGVPCFTLRDTTERPVTVRAGTNTVLGLAPHRIADIPDALRERPGTPLGPPPLWDGQASRRAAEVLMATDRPPSDLTASPTPRMVDVLDL